jgi:hypothetical protein
MSAPAKPEVYLLTESDGFFGQRLMPWESMDTGRLKRILSECFSVIPATYAQIASGSVSPKDSIVIHSSSQQPEYKQFIDDVLLYLHANGNRLVPSIHATRSHENKGYQELHRRLDGIPSLSTRYVAKLSEIDLGAIKYPIVFKDVSGFGSGGVRLIRSKGELSEAGAAERRLSWREARRAFRTATGNFIRKYLLRRKNLRPYGNYYEPMKRFVLQKYVPNLTYDFKVLAFQDRMFLVKRDVRPNDFRASGSGRVQFEDPPPGLLDFSYQLLRKFDEPYMSFDICCDESTFHLLEFQAVHFGPLVLLQSPRHFQRRDGRWQECGGKVELEDIVGESLVAFLQRSPGMSSDLRRPNNV